MQVFQALDRCKYVSRFAFPKLELFGLLTLWRSVLSYD